METGMNERFIRTRRLPGGSVFQSITRARGLKYGFLGIVGRLKLSHKIIFLQENIIHEIEDIILFARRDYSIPM